MAPTAYSPRRALLAALASGLGCAAAQAEGFAVRDLTQVAGAAQSALGSDFTHRAAPERLTLTCPACKGAPVVDVLVGRQNDGTEQRFRSGETTVEKLEQLCRAKSDACRISALKVAPAVGWISVYPMGSATGSTTVILRDGDLLTIRSLSTDAETARKNAETLVGSIAPQIVGR